MGDIVKVFKGSVAAIADLPTSGNTMGDVWTCRETGAQFFWSSVSPTGDLMDWRLINDPEKTAADGTAAGLIVDSLEVTNDVVVGGDIDVVGTGSTIRIGGEDVATVQDVADAVAGGTGAISLGEKSELEMELQYDFSNPSRTKEFIYNTDGDLVQINVYAGTTQLFVADLVYDGSGNLSTFTLERLSDSATLVKTLTYDVGGDLTSVDIVMSVP